jgi:hypothetical protein
MNRSEYIQQQYLQDIILIHPIIQVITHVTLFKSDSRPDYDAAALLIGWLLRCTRMLDLLGYYQPLVVLQLAVECCDAYRNCAKHSKP